MSVYKPRNSKYWQYDFVVQGERFTGPRRGEPRCTTERAALEAERKRRAEVEAGATKEDAGSWRLEDAAWRWFHERSGHGKSARSLRHRIPMLVRCMPANVRLRDITGATVARAIEKRRAVFTRAEKPPTGATVNRDIIAPLRAILRRARRVWGAKAMPEIAWGELAMPEAGELVREYTPAQIEAWKAACGAPADLALHIMLTYGPRFGEMFFHPMDVDAIGARLTLRDRKAGGDHVIPLLKDDARALGALAAQAMAAGYSTVWFDETGPFSYWALHWRIRQAGEKIGLQGGRLIHGARHHAATMIARHGKNLAVAKKLLGHASIASTMRYAHAMEDDIRDALEALPKSPSDVPRIVNAETVSRETSTGKR